MYAVVQDTATTPVMLRDWGRKRPGQENEPPTLTMLDAIALPPLVIAEDNDDFVPASFWQRVIDTINGADY